MGKVKFHGVNVIPLRNYNTDGFTLLFCLFTCAKWYCNFALRFFAFAATFGFILALTAVSKSSYIYKVLPGSGTRSKNSWTPEHEYSYPACGPALNLELKNVSVKPEVFPAQLFMIINRQDRRDTGSVPRTPDTSSLSNFQPCNYRRKLSQILRNILP